MLRAHDSSRMTFNIIQSDQTTQLDVDLRERAQVFLHTSHAHKYERSRSTERHPSPRAILIPVSSFRCSHRWLLSGTLGAIARNRSRR